MHTIEECQALKEYDIVFLATQILATIFRYPEAVESIRKKQKTYFAKFFELSSLNEAIKKQSIRCFLQLVSNIPDCYEKIEKAATDYARETESIPFQTLIQGFGYNDSTMAITLLKFIN